MIPLKTMADAALEECPTLRKVVVVKRTGTLVEMQGGRDEWYHELMSHASSECSCRTDG